MERKKEAFPEQTKMQNKKKNTEIFFQGKKIPTTQNHKIQ